MNTEITILKKAVLLCCVVHLQTKENHNKVVVLYAPLELGV
jgi:hypothetical protein